MHDRASYRYRDEAKRPKVKSKQNTLQNSLPQIDHDADGGHGDLVDVVDVVPVDVVLVDVIAGHGIDVKYHVVKSW